MNAQQQQMQASRGQKEPTPKWEGPHSSSQITAVGLALGWSCTGHTGGALVERSIESIPVSHVTARNGLFNG